MSLRVITYNCRSARINLNIIKLLANECDVLLLQETILNDENHIILDSIEDFNYAHVPSTRKIDVFVGRSSGGLAILYRLFDGLKVTPVYETDRLMGLEINVNNSKILLGNIYCNCDYGTTESSVEYMSIMADLHNFADMNIYDNIVVAGDFNCDPSKGRFYRLLNDFLDDSPFEISDVQKLPQDSYTYISDNEQCSTSFIDHVLSTDPSIVNDFNVLYGSSFYDHIPMLFIFDFLLRN